MHGSTVLFALLYIFYGIASSITSGTPIYSLVIFTILLIATLVEHYGLTFFELCIYYGFGTVVGLLSNIRLHTIRVDFGIHVLSHKQEIMVHFAQLVLALIIFLPLDIVISETAFPLGYFLSFLVYNAYFLFVYAFDYKYYRVGEKSYSHIAFFNRTYLIWYLSLLPFYFMLLSHIIPSLLLSALLATIVIVVVVFIFHSAWKI